MSKIINVEKAVDLIHDGACIMVGGFMGCGNAHTFINALAQKGTKNLTLICNDGAFAGGPDGEEYYGVAKLIHNKQISTIIATHVGLNPEIATQAFVDKTLTTHLIPQGSFVEMIRAAGYGLGGVLTPTGVGTIVEDSPFCLGKQTINGKDYLLMQPLKADFAIIYGEKIDEHGNVWYKGTTSTFNTSMAMAADTVIAEGAQIVDFIVPEDVRTNAILVDYIVKGGMLNG